MTNPYHWVKNCFQCFSWIWFVQATALWEMQFPFLLLMFSNCYPRLALLVFSTFKCNKLPTSELSCLSTKAGDLKKKITPDCLCCPLQESSRAQADEAFWTISSTCSWSQVSSHAQTVFLLQWFAYEQDWKNICYIIIGTSCLGIKLMRHFHFLSCQFFGWDIA